MTMITRVMTGVKAVIAIVIVRETLMTRFDKTLTKKPSLKSED
jgi:hypothetical protein